MPISRTTMGSMYVGSMGFQGQTLICVGSVGEAAVMSMRIVELSISMLAPRKNIAEKQKY